MPPTVNLDVPILMYHHLVTGDKTNEPYTITQQQFKEQVKVLQRHRHTSITFDELFRILAGDTPVPARPVILTFDDAYESFLKLALPVLAAHQMKATVFVVAGELGKFNRWDVERGIEKRQLMDEAGIRTVLKAGIEIGAHGWMHRNLNECSEAEENEEIFRPGQELEERFCFKPRIYSYPYGAHSRKHCSLLRNAGYHGAVSIFSDQPTVTSNLFSMRRIYVHPGDGRFRFRFKLSSLYLRYVGRRDSKRINET